MSNRTKRTVKFLASCSEPEIIRATIRYFPNSSLFKSICNAALNCASGEISLSDTEKSKFQKHRQAFEQLSKKQAISNIKKYLLSNKFKVLTLVPSILHCVLNSIGTSFIVEEPEKKPRKRNVRIPQVHFDQSERTGSFEGEEDPGVQPQCSSSSSSGEEHRGSAI